MNSVNFEDGKKFHISRDQMLQYKEISNQLCRQYGLSVTEVKTKKRARWKDELIETLYDALENTSSKDEFIEYMELHGYKVKWEDEYKYITFTTPEGIKVRDNKLFNECFLKDNLELYFLSGGCLGGLPMDYLNYVTPEHPYKADKTISTGLFEMLCEMFCFIEDEPGYTPQQLNEISQAEKAAIEKILGRKISNEAYLTYCTREDYEQQAWMMRKNIPRLNKDRRLCTMKIEPRNFQLLLRKPKKTKSARKAFCNWILRMVYGIVAC